MKGWKGFKGKCKNNSKSNRRFPSGMTNKTDNDNSNGLWAWVRYG